jgi:hypothetical protein
LIVECTIGTAFRKAAGLTFNRYEFELIEAAGQIRLSKVAGVVMLLRPEDHLLAALGAVRTAVERF